MIHESWSSSLPPICFSSILHKTSLIHMCQLTQYSAMVSNNALDVHSLSAYQVSSAYFLWNGLKKGIKSRYAWFGRNMFQYIGIGMDFPNCKAKKYGIYIKEDFDQLKISCLQKEDKLICNTTVSYRIVLQSFFHILSYKTRPFMKKITC